MATQDFSPEFTYLLERAEDSIGQTRLYLETLARMGDDDPELARDIADWFQDHTAAPEPAAPARMSARRPAACLPHRHWWLRRRPNRWSR